MFCQLIDVVIPVVCGGRLYLLPDIFYSVCGEFLVFVWRRQRGEIIIVFRIILQNAR